MTVDFDSVRKRFPVTKNTIYLSANSITPKPDAVIAAVHEMTDKLADGLLPHFRARGMIEETREKVAKLLGCCADEIAFSRNTAEGVLWAAQSFPWEDGDEVVLSQHEYPSLVYPFLAQEANGVKVVFAKQVNRRITPEAIEECITERTRLVAVTWPQFDTGQRCDLKRISTLCRKRGIVLLVDPIQAIGAIRINVDELGIDILSAGVQKGLLGYQGLGLFYCRRDILDKMRDIHIGWGSLKKQAGLDYDTSTYNHEPLAGAVRYEEGCKNILGIAALNAGLTFIESIGIENIENRVKALTDYLCAQAEKKGCDILSPRQGNEWSGIVLVRPPKQDPYKLAEALMKKSFVILAMNNALLIGINFYNNESDIDQLMEHVIAAD